MSAIAKLYDVILCNRFLQWYKPKFEQAGAQKGRGCEEQIFVIRLLIDIARKCKFPLYIGYVDYMKAYDKVRRNVLLDMLYRAGCGTIFLMAIAASLVNCSGLIGGKIFETSAGVRQGASTSCPLFTFFIDATITAVCALGPDGWLENLHILLLMDDTVIFATSRASLLAKLRVLKQKADELGMEIHPTKSKFMSTDSSDTSPIVIDSVIMSHTNTYVYLGAVISMENIADQVKLHFKEKYYQVLKFYAFLYKNNDAPFYIKKRVWDSCLTSALFYSSETWFTNNLRPAESIYLASLKQLVSVRNSTPTDCLLAECELPTAKAYIRNKQLVFLRKLFARDNFRESYIGKALTLAQRHKTPASKVIDELLALPETHNIVTTSIYDTKQRISISEKTRAATYFKINPTLNPHVVYTSLCIVPEYMRIAFSRMRLSSHRLKIETGRWSRPKIPELERLCECGNNVQNEEHAILKCPLTDHLRSAIPLIRNDPDITIDQILNVQEDYAFEICKLCESVLRFFNR